MNVKLVIGLCMLLILIVGCDKPLKEVFIQIDDDFGKKVIFIL